MSVLTLMAGDANRFKAIGIETPKPMIEVNDKSILEWTTRSLPFISHYGEVSEKQLSSEDLYFAIREEHELKYDMTEWLKKIYGSDINIIMFNNTTRGNLETAFISSMIMKPEDSLLVLDCDNKYDSSDIVETMEEAYDFEDSMIVCYFDPIDENTKWSFALISEPFVKEILEKDPEALKKGGYPLVGTFWFHSTKLFSDYAKFIIANGWKVGTKGKEEFYMSQVPSLHAVNGQPVFAHKVNNVIPLGTPEDIKEFKL